MMRLKEIDIIRSWVILLVIAVHTLAPFTGAWKLPQYFEANVILWWLGKLFYSGMLETFVFISGYVFAIKKIPSTFHDKAIYIFKKGKRLYLPCLIFGFIMTLLFSNNNIQSNIISILNGKYHLWFLPMLLWCFIFEIFIVPSIKRSKFLILFLIAILPYPPLPLFINNAFYYLFFFHLGNFVYSRKKYIGYLITKNQSKIIILYALLFIIHTLLTNYINNLEEINICIKAMFISFGHILRLLTAILVVMIYYKIGCVLQRNDKIYCIAKIVAKYSMGIYLFQEIILRFMYYKIGIHLYNNFYLLFIIYLVTFSSSLGMTYVFSKNRFTKKIVS